MARALILVLVALVVTACGDDDGSRPINFQVSGDPEEIAVYRDLIKRSGQDVRLIEVGDRKDHLAKLTTSFAARRPPDVFLINYRNLGGFASRGVIETVGDRVDVSGFYPITLQAFTVGGKLQCVAQNASSLVVYLNLDLLRAAGLRPPAGNWTYARFLDAARKLRRDGRFGVAIDPNAIRATAFVLSAGGRLVEEGRLALDTPAARRGVQALLDLRRLNLAPDARASAALPADERFVQGEVAMFMSSRRDVPVLRTIKAFEWDVAPFPAIEHPASVLHSDGFCVARGAPDEAWEFVRFAVGREGQRLLARGGRTVPSLHSVAESAAFLESTPPENNQVFLDQIPTMGRMPTTSNWTRVEETIDLAIEEAYYGRLSLDAALRRIRSETGGRP